MRIMSIETPPRTAWTWPSSEVPVPKGTTATPAAAHSLTMAATSSVVSGKHTAAGGSAGCQLSSLPWAWQTAWETLTRSPKSALKSS